MKYFEIDRIKEAIEHLQHYHSIWVLVPLVLAVNKMGDDELTDGGSADVRGGTGAIV